MSSLLDSVLNSDNLERDLAAASTPGSDTGSQRRPRARSTSRLQGPPSESNAANSDNEGGFADDEVVGSRGPMRKPLGPRSDIPRVVDELGETLSVRFEQFLEE